MPLRTNSEHFLNELVEDARDRRHLVVARDFNTWASKRDNRETNRRGEILCDVAAALQLTLLNSGTKLRFTRNELNSIVDLTLANESLSRRNRDNMYVLQLQVGTKHQFLKLCTCILDIHIRFNLNFKVYHYNNETACLKLP